MEQTLTGSGNDHSWLDADHRLGLKPIAENVQPAFAPATHYLFEWKDYFLPFPGAKQLRVGTRHIAPVRPDSDLFHLRFENQLGLASLQPFAGGRPLTPPAYVEVISPKFPTLDAHLSFFQNLLDDLFNRAARIPFTFAGDTARGVKEALRPPTPLFTLHFLNQYHQQLHGALATVHGRPHRRLADFPAVVPLAEASEVGPDVLLEILHNPDRWVPASGLALARRLGGRAPAEVWQRRPVESFDTPENRFMLAFVKQLLAAAEGLPSQDWWGSVPDARGQVVLSATHHLRQTAGWSIWAEVGPMQRLPLSSRVLMQRAGYQEMLQLWRLFHHARRPLFEPLQKAIELRDVATLYEIWVFFWLVEEIRQALGVEPVAELRVSDRHGLGWGAKAKFGKEGTLYYNRRRQGYSLAVRPDYSWVRSGKRTVVFDAKFRLEWDQEQGQTSPKRGDLYRMHTYRDALRHEGVRTAVILYPGDESVFFDTVYGKQLNIKLLAILQSVYKGVGALPAQPHTSAEETQ